MFPQEGTIIVMPSYNEMQLSNILYHLKTGTINNIITITNNGIGKVPHKHDFYCNLVIVIGSTSCNKRYTYRFTVYNIQTKSTKTGSA